MRPGRPVLFIPPVPVHPPLPPLLTHSSPILPFFSFQSLTNCKFCNSFVFTFIQNAGGVPSSLRPPEFRILFQVPYVLSPLFSTLTKTAGVGGHSSHSGTRPPSRSLR